jgi:FtsZ-binding cell division protein ZapB
MELLAKFCNNTTLNNNTNKDLITMTNAETILKLNEALSTLIKAYEELQEENTGLKARINELEDEVLDLESAKEDLEKNVDEFKNHTEKDKSNISSMLGKIESILNKKSSNTSTTSSNHTSSTPVETPKEKVEEKKDDIFSNPSNPASNTLLDNVKKEEESNSNKIDLNRMASLLNGFNH